MRNKSEKTKKDKSNSLYKLSKKYEKVQNGLKIDKKKASESESAAKKRTNAVLNDQNIVSKKHCSSNTNDVHIAPLIEAIEVEEALELDTHITFINGHYVQSIASKTNENDYELKTSIQQVLELMSNLLPLNDGTNQFAWSEVLHAKLVNSTSLKHLVSTFLDDANIKKWMQENKFVLQRLLSHPCVETVYVDILNDKLVACKNVHSLRWSGLKNTQIDTVKQELDQLQDYIQELPTKSMGEKLAYYHNPFKMKDITDTIRKESGLAFQQEVDERMGKMISMLSVTPESLLKNAPIFFNNSSIEQVEDSVGLMDSDDEVDVYDSSSHEM